jgi:hypothetical protein
MKKLFFTAFFLSVGWASVAHAVPDITNVTYSGTLAAGTTVTITLTGGGATGPTLVMLDTFESGVNGSSIAAASAGDYGDWDAVGSSAPLYTTSNYYSGSKSLMVQSDWTSNGGSWYAELNLSSATNVFWCIDWSIDGNWPGYYNTSGGSGVNNKFGWLMYDNTTTNTDLYYAYLNSSTNTAPNSWLFDSNDSLAATKTFLFNTSTTTAANPKPETDWHNNCVWINGLAPGDMKFIDRTSSGTMRVAYSTTNLAVPFLSEPTIQQTHWKLQHFPGYLRNDPSGSGQRFYQDNIYVATGTAAAAHIVMFNAPRLQQATKRVILKPITWSDTSITAMLPTTVFSNETAYITVCDSTFVCDDSGYAVTVGSAQGGGSSGGASSTGQRGSSMRGLTQR